MIVVTGAAGFIGCNLIKGLNALGHTDILAVDDLTDGKKYINLAAAKFRDYMDYEDFLAKIKNRETWPEAINVILHAGACSDTTEWDGRYMMRINYDYSKTLLHYCLEQRIQFIYASSAAVYGDNTDFDDNAETQLPLNVYGYSKWLFDQYVLQQLPSASSQVVGLRYFNVYGPHENHKGKMASVAFHLMNQLQQDHEVRLFEGSHGYGPGEQERDFIFVEDVVKVNLWMMQHPKVSGIFNVGTGKARPFNAIAETLLELHGSGSMRYIPFPASLKDAYQSFTQANISKLRSVGYDAEFYSLEAGLENYYRWYTHLNPSLVSTVQAERVHRYTDPT